MPGPAPAILAERLEVRRGGAQVLHSIDLQISVGDFVGITGPNGGGSPPCSLRSSESWLRVRGIQVLGASPRDRCPFVERSDGWLKRASNIPRNLRISVRELVGLGIPSTLGFGRQDERLQRIEKALSTVSLLDLAERDIATLSGGQRQRAILGRVLASEAQLLLLDEPMVGIDQEVRFEFLEALDRICHDEGRTLIMITHDLQSIHQATHRVIHLDRTIRFDGRPRDLPSASTMIREKGLPNVHDRLWWLEMSPTYDRWREPDGCWYTAGGHPPSVFELMAPWMPGEVFPFLFTLSYGWRVLTAGVFIALGVAAWIGNFLIVRNFSFSVRGSHMSPSPLSRWNRPRG